MAVRFLCFPAYTHPLSVNSRRGKLPPHLQCRTISDPLHRRRSPDCCSRVCSNPWLRWDRRSGSPLLGLACLCSCSHLRKLAKKVLNNNLKNKKGSKTTVNPSTISNHTFSPVPQFDLTAQKRSSNAASADVSDCRRRRSALVTTFSLSTRPHNLQHCKSLLTFCDGARSTGLGQAVALTHWTAETHVHKPLSGGREGSSSRQHHPHPSSQEFLHFPEQQAAERDCRVFRFQAKQRNSWKLREGASWLLTHCRGVRHSLSWSALVYSCSPT